MSTLPKSAQALYIGMIPDLDFQIICYETKHGFYVLMNHDHKNVKKVTGQYSGSHVNRNRCIKDAWTLNTGGYAEMYFDRETLQRFLSKMLDMSCQIEGIHHKDCYFLEQLKW